MLTWIDTAMLEIVASRDELRKEAKALIDRYRNHQFVGNEGLKSRVELKLRKVVCRREPGEDSEPA